MSTPHAVIVAALSVPLPCPVCSRAEACRCIRPEGYSATEERATLIVAALTEHGHLPEPSNQPTAADYREAALYLAARSRFIRYDDDGWTKLLESPVDVAVAHAKAQDNVTAGEQESIGQAKDLLLAGHAAGVFTSE